MSEIPQGAPNPKDTMDFLQQGGSFALLCVLVVGGGVAMGFAGRAMFKLLREFLGTMTQQLEALGKGQTTGTDVLIQMKTELGMLRTKSEDVAAVTGEWGSPTWLQERLTQLETHCEGIKAQISELRIQIAGRGAA